MSPLLFFAVSVAGGLGASSRFILDGLIRSRSSSSTPWATISINVSGSFLLGLLTGFAASAILPHVWLPILGTGFLGGYTTFSTASVETVRLVVAKQWRSAVISGLGTLVVTTGAAWVGIVAGTAA